MIIQEVIDRMGIVSMPGWMYNEITGCTPVSLTYIPIERSVGMKQLVLRLLIGIALVILFPLGGTTGVFSAETPGDDTEAALSLMKESLEIIHTIHDYQAIFYKQDRVNGNLLSEEKILMKWMAPQHIYMRFEEGEQKGQELIYVEGRNDNLMTVSPGGVMGMMTIDIAPDSDMALKKNRHTVPEAGIGPNLSLALSILETHFRDPASTIWVEYTEMISFHGEECYLIRIHESGYAHLTEVYIYRNTKLPAAFISYDEGGELLESYRYTDISTNIGLDEYDFDPNNEEYDF